ncbi:hypothetical protein AADZ86_12505 [Colwelliaceae bacterium BS250]
MIINKLIINLDALWQLLLIVLLLASLLTTVYFLKQRLTSKQTPKPGWQFGKFVVINCLATLAIIGLITKPAWLTEPQHSAVLLTDGFNEQLNYQGPLIYRLEQHLQAADDSFSILQSPQQLQIRHPNLKKLSVFGYGLERQQLQQLSALNIDFTAAKNSPGLVTAHWNKQLILGEFLTFTGRYINHQDAGIGKLTLKDLAGLILLEKQLLPGESVQLSTQPKTLGQYTYQLELTNSKGQLIEQQQLAVSVSAKSMAKILILQSAPSFESKHLANWASKEHAQLVILTKISKGKFLTQGINVDKQLQLELNPQLLASQDLLVVDGRALLNLNKQQQLWLEQAVNDGLGVMVNADTQLIDSFTRQTLALLSSFKLQSSKVADSLVYPSWPTATALHKTNEVALQSISATIFAEHGKVLIKANNRALNVATPFGLGQVSISLLRERFRWATQGERVTYSHYWHYILSQLSRADNSARFIASSSSTPLLSTQKQQICLQANSPNLELQLTHLATQQTVDIALNRSQIVTDHYCGFYWPQHVGWYKASLYDGNSQQTLTSQFIYASSNTDWSTWQQQQKLTATNNYLKNNSGLNNNAQPKLTPVAIKDIYFWWLLIICASLIWLEKRAEPI